MSDAPNFMQSALAVWIQTFSLEPVSYKDLVDGIYLNEVLQQIDPKSSLDGMKNNLEDARDKMINWELLLRNIKSFYQDVLDCYVVMKPPNIYEICTCPESEVARLEVLKALHLLLGCAINCEVKEVFIEGITCLPEEVQLSMMHYIQQLKEFDSNVVATRLPPEELDDVTIALYNHLSLLLQQRDEYLQEVKSLRLLMDEADLDQSFVQSISNTDNGIPEVISRYAPPSMSTSSRSNKNHLVVEIAECKARIRRLRHDLEDRDDVVAELEGEVDGLKQNIQKLKNENLELVRDARAAKTYQDELDIMREKVNRCERLEVDIQRYKEKLNDLDFYKSRVDELRQDNTVLHDNRSIMEEQLKAAHKRIEAVVELEKELQKHKEQRETLIMECDRHRLQAQNLIEENAKLEYEKEVHRSLLMDEEQQAMLESVNKDSSPSLFDQLSQVENSQMLRIELENQRLKQELEQVKETAMLENASKMLALEKENSRLAAKVERFLETSTREEQRFQDLEHSNQELSRERKNLEETIEVLKETSERQVKELEKENEQLSQMMVSLRERSEKTNDLRVQDLELENRQLNESLKQFMAKVAQLEQERRSLNRRSKHLTDESDRCRVLEMENRKFEVENEELKNTVDTLQATCDRQSALENELMTADIERQKLARTVEALQKTATKKDALELENRNLTVELQSLRHSVESMKSRIKNLEIDDDSLNRQVQRLMEQSKLDTLQLEKLELEKCNLNMEKEQLQKNLEASKQKVRAVEQDLEQQESQYAEQVKKMEELRRYCRQLEEVEKRCEDLEADIEQVKRDKTNVDKENKRLKLTLQEKDLEIDSMSAKVTELEQGLKVLRPLAERNRELESSVSDLEKENLGLMQSMTIDKKTIGTLREDLVNEKIRCQQMQVDLENQQRQLQMLSISNEKSVMSGIAKDEGTIKVLESKMEEVYEKRIRSKDEQIELLEKRIDEYKGQVLKLQSDLDASKVEYSAGSTPSKERTLVVTQRYSNSPSATQDIINLKDHIIKLERMNAALEAENRNIQRQNRELQDHIKQLQSQNSQWQTQMLSFQTQHNNMQSQLAMAEVENRTLLSENASLSTQNYNLQETCSRTESAVTRFQRSHEEMTRGHESLERDLERLQHVHDQLTSEHEALIVKHASLKDVYRGSKADVKQLQQKFSELTREKDMTDQLKKMLEQDKESLRSESRHFESLQTDYIHVREDNLRLLNANDKVTGELQECQKELRATKAEVLQLKTKIDGLNGEIAVLNKQIGDRNAEHSKLVFRLEETYQWATKLEEDNQTLMTQMKLLITQNQDLLTKLLQSKDQQVAEQKEYVERLASLRKQKEHLEEKVMEQYRRYDPVKNKQKSLTVKFKQMIKGKSREPGNSGVGLDGSDSMENSSHGSAPSTENLPMPDRAVMDHVDGELAGGESKSSAQQMKIKRGNGTGIASGMDHRSREIATNTTFEREDDPITLNEFLSECNQSPKSRRRLLVEKQVALDDNIDSISDITQQLLRPRQATISGDNRHANPATLKPFSSEINIHSQAELNRRFRALPNKTAPDGNRPQTTHEQILRPRVRPLAPRPVSTAKIEGIEQAFSHLLRHPPVARSQNFQQNSPFAEQTSAAASESRRSRPVRTQSCYDGHTSSRPSNYDASRPVYAGVEPPSMGNPGARNRLSYVYRGHQETNVASSNPSDQAYASMLRKTDLRTSKPRIESVLFEGQRTRDYGVQQQGQGHGQHHSTSGSIGLAAGPHFEDDAGLNSQYHPGNVRNLVHSYQQALKPGSTSSPQHSTPKDRGLRPHSAAATPSPSRSSCSDVPSRPMRNSLSRPPVMIGTENRQEGKSGETRLESNVCIVRPASGRTLPTNPNEGARSDSNTTSRNDPTAGCSDVVPLTRSSSAKGAKPPVYLEYGLL